MKTRPGGTPTAEHGLCCVMRCLINAWVHEVYIFSAYDVLRCIYCRFMVDFGMDSHVYVLTYIVYTCTCMYAFDPLIF